MKKSFEHEVIDNFLPLHEYQIVKDTLTANKFPWFFNQNKSSDGELMGKEDVYNNQFIHLFYMNYSVNSPFFEPVIGPFIKIISPLSILKIKANLTTATDEVIKYGWHTDGQFDPVMAKDKYKNLKSKTAVYYLNTNNGKTIFKNGLEVDSIANRIVIFDSNAPHTGTSCSDSKYRCVINFNYV